MKRQLTLYSKFTNMIVMLVPFLLCWFFYYEERTLSTHSRQAFIILICLYCAIYYSIAYRMDGFRFQTGRVHDLVFGQILSIGVTDCVSYLMIWMLSVHIPNILPGFCAFVAQCILSIVWSIVAQQRYFATHPPIKTIVIYDVRPGVEKLISEYGLEIRYKIVATIDVKKAISNLHLLDEIQAVFLCGIHSADRNIILKYCIANNIRVLMIPRVGDVVMSASEPMHILHLPIMYCRRRRPASGYLLVKRATDILASGLALLIFSPLMLVTTIAVKHDGGPAFYKQVRLTKDGKKFEILKFRSMCVDAEKISGAVLSAGENDPRITKVGRIIRACRVDELPQLINILKGDMTLVGPRPERPEIAEEYEKELPEFRLRLQVKAGLTGYAQVYGKYNTEPYDKLLMDLIYIARMGILEDLCIMLGTMKILFSKESTEGIDKGKTNAM